MKRFLIILLALLCIGWICNASAYSKSEVQAWLISRLYGGAGGSVTCDFDGYVNTSGRHEGIDFSLRNGAAVYAICEGTVTRVTVGSTGSNGLSTIAIYYAPADKTVVYLHTAPLSGLASGQTVSAGQQIATQSWRGVSSSGSGHTHVEVVNGWATSARKSVNDYTLENDNPYPFWESVMNGNPDPQCNCSSSYEGTYICTTSTANLTIRSGHGTGYSSVGAIPPGAEVYVSKADGTWAHVTYNGVSGYASMEYLQKKEDNTEPDEMTSGFGQPVSDGTYVVRLASNNDYRMDIAGYDLPAPNGANVQLYGPQNGTVDPSDVLSFSYAGNGFYAIRQAGADMAIDVSGGSKQMGANVQVYADNGTTAQRWAVKDNGDGTFTFYSKLTGYVMDVEGGNIALDTNIRMWESNGTAAQKWLIIPYTEPASIDASKTSVSLTLPDQSVETITLTINGPWSNLTSHDEGIGFSAGFSSGIYDGNKIDLQITGTAEGSGTVTISQIADGNVVATKTIYVSVSEAASIDASKTSVSLTLPDQSVETITLTINGPWSNLTSHDEGTGFSAGFSSDIYDGNKIDLQITGTGEGSGTVTISQIADGNVVATKTINVTVRTMQYTLSYNANGGSGEPIDQTCSSGDTLTIPMTIPTRFGYDFLGWGISSGSSSASYYPGETITITTNKTLYAVWKNAVLIDRPSLPRTVDVNMNIAGAARYLRIIPLSSGDLVLETTGSYDTCGILYDSSGSQLKSNDDGGNGNNFRITYNLSAGTSYYLRVTMYSSTLAPGYITVSISAPVYTVTFDPNGGTGAPSSQTKTHGTALTLSSVKPTRANSSAGSYTVTLDANGGTVSPSTLTAARTTSYTFKNWNTESDGTGTSYASGGSYTANADATLYAQWNSDTAAAAVNLPTPARNGYSFKGWGTSASASSGFTGSYTPSNNITLYAIWEDKITYTIAYNANGGTGTPSSQTKEENVPLTLSSLTPTKTYLIQYNANGGNVSPASKSVSCTFRNWNTAINGSGTAYAPGDTYTANADVTLYAQWTNPTAGALATPSRSGYAFAGWFTSATGGTQISDTTTITGNITVYAHWTDIYNLGDETYSFHNYSDHDSNGHCFGMAATSSGYHLNLLNIQRIGGNANTPLYSFSDTATVRLPICYYQGLQGWRAINATVAGGSFWSYGRANMASDWPSVVNYVRNHQHDDTGNLLVTFWKEKSNSWSGHAVNFLRYENVNGQDRLYVYDNNNPTGETYFYRDSSGYVWEKPYSTYGNVPIDSIGLHDVRTYFGNCNSFDPTHVLYTPATGVSVKGYSSTPLVGELEDEPYVMYEIPSDQQQVTIIPNRDYADVIYMNTEYSFGEITEGTYAVLKFASLNAAGDVVQSADFQIFDGDLVFGVPDFTLPSALTKIGESAFNGISATTVYIPDTCTSIGAYAFRNSAVRKIRIPAGCSIADNAFYGCEAVKIFGTPGSAAETFCNTHSNCTFISE